MGPGTDPFRLLEDGLVVSIIAMLTPLPDLFNARAVCKASNAAHRSACMRLAAVLVLI